MLTLFFNFFDSELFFRNGFHLRLVFYLRQEVVLGIFTFRFGTLGISSVTFRFSFGTLLVGESRIRSRTRRRIPSLPSPGHPMGAGLLQEETGKYFLFIYTSEFNSHNYYYSIFKCLLNLQALLFYLLVI